MQKGQRGFSLLEMAVATFVLVLLLGSLLVPLGTQIEQRQITETERILEETREALIGFALINGRLPRPATSATNGAENPAACGSELACSGFVPWTTLGTSRTDAWGKLIRYSVTPALANSAFTYATLTTGATKTVQTRSSAGVLTNMATGVTAVIFSHGFRNWGTTDNGLALPDASATNVDEDTNNSASVTFISRTFSGGTSAAGGEFDDLVIWIPATTLTSRLASAGRLPN
jgi:prepilin-type N-terminal cleavage/methylation domain-containing protein